MTEHEDLIAEANENLHKAADAAPASARQAILTGKVEDQRMSLIARLKHALEKVTAERDQLAAVVREALDVARSGSVPLGVQEARHYDRLLAETRRVLQGAPSVALDRVKAEAVREAADAFEGGTINVEIFEDSAEARRWEASNAARERIVASMRARADRIEKGESNE